MTKWCCRVLCQKITMKTLSGRKMLTLSTTEALACLSTLHLNNNIFHFKNKLKLEQKINTKEYKITHKSKNPSTIVWISRDTTSLEK